MIKFIKNHQERFLFLAIVILVALISFRAGMLKEREEKTSDIKVLISNNKPITEEEKKAIALGTAVQRKGLTEKIQGSQNIQQSNENCNFIGSINSDKYHTPDCHWSEKIKEENRVCFETVKEAKNKGYQAAGCCGD
jgi:hypothetical protein